MRPRQSASASAYVVAAMSFASDVPVVGTAVRRGERLPADSPVVRAHSHYFVVEGEPLPPMDAARYAESEQTREPHAQRAPAPLVIPQQTTQVKGHPR